MKTDTAKPPPGRWWVCAYGYNDEALQAMLTLGYEPFAVTDGNMVWLRRYVRGGIKYAK